MEPVERKRVYDKITKGYQTLINQCLPKIQSKVQLLDLVMTLKHAGNPHGVYKPVRAIFSTFKELDLINVAKHTPTGFIAKYFPNITFELSDQKMLGRLIRINLDLLAESLIKEYQLEADISARLVVPDKKMVADSHRIEIEDGKMTTAVAPVAAEIEMVALKRKATEWWDKRKAKEQQEIIAMCKTSPHQKQLARIPTLKDFKETEVVDPLYYYLASRNITALRYPKITEAQTNNFNIGGGALPSAGGDGEAAVIVAIIVIIFSLVIYAGYSIYDASKDILCDTHLQKKLAGTWRLLSMAGTGASLYWLIPVMVASTTPIGQMVLLGLALVCAAALVSHVIGKLACVISNYVNHPDAISYWNYSTWELSPTHIENIVAKGANPEAVRGMLRAIKNEYDSSDKPRRAQLDAIREGLQTGTMLQPCQIGGTLYFPNGDASGQGVVTDVRTRLLSPSPSIGSMASTFSFDGIHDPFARSSSSLTAKARGRLSSIQSGSPAVVVDEEAKRLPHSASTSSTSSVGCCVQ
ncbi:hypothetical protein BH10PSE19_BH10PSE19_12470 [soil metagenome]